MYVNPQGITGKINSLAAVAKASNAQVIGLAETKLGKTPPRVPGYNWYNKPRKHGSGGVAILVREDIKHMTERIEDMEDHEQEIIWIRIKNKTPVDIGVFYGPQEKCSNEEAQRQYSQLTSQINKLASKDEVILMGDFNAKVDVQTEDVRQEESRNGKYMQEMLHSTNLVNKSITGGLGTWTRVNRKNTSERSIIDYVIMTKNIAEKTDYIEIDEEGIYRLKGKEESDHNTIIIESQIPSTKKVEKQTMYNLNDRKKWKLFNQRLHDNYHQKEPESYENFERLIKSTMEKTFDKITIEKGKFRLKLNDKAKALKNEKKAKRKHFENATTDEKKNKLDDYIETQKLLRKEMEYIEKQTVQTRIKKIIQEGGIKSNSFWKIRKKIMKNGKSEDDYDVITEDDTVITDPEEAKEYIAQYYENLYQAREGTEKYKEWTEKIKRTVEEIENTLEQAADERPTEDMQFTPDEMNQAIRCLKPGKAPGPDGIPNEILKKANNLTLPIYLQEMNKVMGSRTIPAQ